MKRLVGILSLLLLLAWLPASFAQDVTVEALNPTVEAQPREAMHLNARLINESATTWSGTPELNLPEGWRALIPPAPVTLEAGERGTALFTVLPPATAPAGRYEITLSYPPSPADTGATARFTVLVQRVSSLEVTLLDAPSFVIAEPYTARFLVTNRGNAPEDVRFTLTDNLGFTLTTPNAGARLEPGSSTEVPVRVVPVQNLPHAEQHWVRLRVEAANAPAGAGAQVATARVEVLPRTLPESARYHRLPLRVRFALDLSTGASSTTEAGASGFTIELHGNGRLSDQDPGRLSISLSNTFGRSHHRNTVAYQRDSFGVTLGDQTISLSPMLRFSDAAGISVNGTGLLTPSLAVSGHLHAFARDEERFLAARVAAVAFEQVEVSVHAVIPSESNPVMGVQVHADRETQGGESISFRIEYDRETAGGATAARVESDLQADAARFTVSWEERSAGFGDAAFGRTRFTARADAFLSGAPTTRASAWLQGVTLHEGTLVADLPEDTWRTVWGAAVHSANAEARWSVAYQDQLAFAGKRVREVSVSATLPILQELTLASEWQWTQAPLEASPQRTMEFAAVTPFHLLGGRAQASIGTRFAGTVPEFERLDVAFAWWGSPSRRLDLRAGAEFRYGKEAYASATLGARFEMHDGKVLDASLTPRFPLEAPPSLRASVGVTLPVSVRLGRLSTVGEVVGVVQDDEGAGVPGVQVRLAGLVAFTDQSGRFRFPAVPHGEHFLLMELPTGFSDRIALPSLPLPLSVTPEGVDALEFTLIRPGRVAGRIVLVEPEAPAGKAAGGVLVQPDTAGVTRGLTVSLRNDDTVLRAVTDEEGAFVFERVLPGEWEVVVEAERLGNQFRVEPPRQRVRVGPGGQVEVGFELVPEARRVRIQEGETLGPAPP